jgi:hypothetical protein
LLLDAFGDHRDIVPCFKTLRRLLGLDLEGPLPSPSELEARVASAPQNLLVIGHMEGQHPEGYCEPLPGGGPEGQRDAGLRDMLKHQHRHCPANASRETGLRPQGAARAWLPSSARRPRGRWTTRAQRRRYDDPHPRHRGAGECNRPRVRAHARPTEAPSTRPATLRGWRRSAGGDRDGDPRDRIRLIREPARRACCAAAAGDSAGAVADGVPGRHGLAPALAR